MLPKSFLSLSLISYLSFSPAFASFAITEDNIGDFKKLPLEITRECVDNLKGVQDLKNLRLVSKGFNTIIDDPSRWGEHIVKITPENTQYLINNLLFIQKLDIEFSTVFENEIAHDLIFIYIKKLASAGKIHTLNLTNNTVIDNRTVRALLATPGITELSLHSCRQISGRAFPEESTIQSLNLRHTGITKGIGRLGKFSNLRNLSLASLMVEDRHLGPLSHLTNLENLNLNGTLITTEGIQTLSTFRNLRTLSLCGLPVNDKHLSMFDHIETLTLGSILSISETGLSALTNVRTLILLEAPIKNEHLEALEHLHKLKEIEITGCLYISDISTLFNLKLVKMQNRFAPRISSENIQKLRDNAEAVGNYEIEIIQIT
jgi:hypothetical protein